MQCSYQLANAHSIAALARPHIRDRDTEPTKGAYLSCTSMPVAAVENTMFAYSVQYHTCPPNKVRETAVVSESKHSFAKP